MDCKYHYDRLIATRKNRELQEGVYYEKHHIIPKSMGGSNCKSNLVHLTAREHYIAHLLLYKFSGSVSMVRAFVMISARFKKSGRVYEEAMIERNKLHIGKKRGQSFKDKMAINAARGKNNAKYKEVISTNVKTGEVIIMGLKETANYFNVGFELIRLRVRGERKKAHINSPILPRRKLTDWDIRYNNDKTTQEIQTAI